MTFQVRDTAIYRERRFDVIGIAGKGLFDPRLRGFPPNHDLTSYWRGFVCHYAVADDRLWLRDVHLMDGKLHEPEGHGILAWFQRRTWKAEREKRHRLFREDLDKPVPFTGGLLIKTPWDPDQRNPLEIQELVFDDGRLIDALDRSEEMKLWIEETRRKEQEFEERVSRYSDLDDANAQEPELFDLDETHSPVSLDPVRQAGTCEFETYRLGWMSYSGGF